MNLKSTLSIISKKTGTNYKTMTSLTFYGGINEIGGNKILLDDNGTRIFLDFGQFIELGTTFIPEFHHEEFNFFSLLNFRKIPKSVLNPSHKSLHPQILEFPRFSG